ncbi:MAG: threonine--tRNA ligase [Candidatus Aenigmarchaeota archaeon]|nr:threonine--tRNA ligase [Candidatus Aenigmarchaeota archaeon]
MKLLLIHADHIEWAAVKKAIPAAEEAGSGTADEALVAFCAVEKGDEKDLPKVVEQAAAEILNVAGQVKAKSLVLYPYAHLSSQLSSPGAALQGLKDLERALHGKLPVTRAPFGWYKSFTLQAKGHPLAELSRTITAEGRQPLKPRPAGKIILDRRELPPNDHRILGEDLKIFHLADEIGAGLPLWLPNGETIRHELVEFMRKTEERWGYRYVSTPHIAKGDIFHATGHLPYYRDTMYAPIDIDGQEFYLKPMNCPHHHMIFRKLVTSYRDLPLRLAEPGMTYRYELSGVTYGLLRVRAFTQNDSHIYVTADQLKVEFTRVLQLFDEVYKVMHIKDYWFRLSLPDFQKNPDKFTGDPQAWEHASAEIRAAMREHGAKFVEEIGEAAFYGPKIDVQIKNAQGKEETIATSQVDIVVPARLGLTYTDRDDQKRPVIIIHRAILGSYERFIGFLLEQTAGALPVWLAPVQVRVLSFTERNAAAAEALVQELRERGIRAEADVHDHTVEYKVRDAEVMKVPYIVVIGDKEAEAGTLAVRERGKKKVAFGVKKAAFIADLEKRIASRR